MKKLLCLLCVVFILAGNVTVFAGNALKTDLRDSRIVAVKEDIDGDFRAVWVSSVLNLDFPSKKGVSLEQMKTEILSTLDRTKDIGLNAVILQVRPTADALYKSAIFPWSEYLTGTQGKAPEGGFDPLKFWVDEAHKRGLELHAWINPYRVTHSAEKRTNVSTLAVSNPARKNPSWVITYKNAMYFDPGLPETKKLVIDGIVEIINNYDVDGIHLDDYFYPDSDFPDKKTYDKYGGGKALADWRRDNVNELIKGIQKAINENKPSVRFGVSPFAIWQNKSSTPAESTVLGTETRGLESYKTHYADTVRWVKEGWLDYICPQIYWNIGYEIADYKIILNWWENICRDSGVDLYVGQAAYREFEGQNGWTGETMRQLKLNETGGVVKGSVYFRYGSIKGELGDKIKAYYAFKDTASATNPVFTPHRLAVNRPAEKVSTTGEKYYLLGVSDPGKPLFMNGILVEGRTKEGFFGVFCDLVMGDNKFVFTQEGQENCVSIVTRKAPATTTPSTGGSKITINKIDANTPYYATVTSDSAWLYPSYSQNGGSSWQLLKGQKDIVVETTSDKSWIKLGCGMWIEKAYVSLSTESKFISAAISDAKFTKGINIDLISFTSPAYTAVNANYDGEKLTVSFGMRIKTLPSLSIAGSPVFESVEITEIKGIPSYVFNLKKGETIEGYYTDYKDGVFRLNIKRKRSLAEGDKPLSGFKFVLDAGHGGSDSGAYGPLGDEACEKILNLIYTQNVAKRLEDLGAKVVRVRDSDVAVTLQERTEISRKENPDMFISIHGNSIEATTNASRTSGLSVWYRNPASKPLAEVMVDRLYAVNPYTNRYKQVNQSNFFVCRPPWSPSVIIETSFLPNVNDYSWLLHLENQDLLSSEIVNAVLTYYRGK